LVRRLWGLKGHESKKAGGYAKSKRGRRKGQEEYGPDVTLTTGEISTGPEVAGHRFLTKLEGG